MDNAMHMLAEMAARLLLQEYRSAHTGWTDAKTPIDELVSWLGLHIETFHPADYAAGTYGFIDPDEDEGLIWLCRDMPESLRRFTLAHELGHAILHCHAGSYVRALAEKFADIVPLLIEQEILPAASRADPCQLADVQEDSVGIFAQEQFQEAPGIGQSYDPRSQREMAANTFAAELLIPSEHLRTLYLSEQIPPQALASTFGVSQAALLNRLFGLLSGRGTPPLQEVERETTEKPAVATAKKPYDEFQQMAVAAATPALIVAGPGSGKTSTLIGRVEYLIRTLGIPPPQILALTFSRKAALEMTERLQSVVGNALRMQPKVSTFHAFCADLLRHHGSLVGLRTNFALIDDAEAYFLLRQQANKMRLRHYQKLQAPAYYFPDFLQAISRAKDELVSPTDYAILARRMQESAQDAEEQERAEKALEIAHIYHLYQEELARRGDTDFGGLLMLTLQLFREQAEILSEQQQRYQHILVDEFQDVNRASGVLLRELAGTEKQVWVVGDANQAIYGFRGASPANISQFAQDFPGAVILPLGRNYRSRPDLVALAESFRCKQLEVGQEAGKNQPVRLTESDPYVTLACASDEASEFAGIVQDMRYKHAQGYMYRDMIVLCRTRALGQKISRILAEKGLPVIEQGGMLEQEYIKDILSILLLLTDKSGMGLLRAAQQPEHPLTQSDIEKILLAARLPKMNPRSLLLSDAPPFDMSSAGRHALTRLSQLMHVLQHTTDMWSLLAHYLLIETPRVREQLAMTPNKHSNAILADYERLLQLARHYDQQQTLHAPQLEDASVASEVEGVSAEERVKGFLDYIRLLILLRQDGGSRQGSSEENEQDADIVRVMTVHASKGLEFPIVYMPGLVQRRFPLQARTRAVAHPDGMLLPESEGTIAHESGESCLFYVGVTRARDQLVLSYSERYGKIAYKRSPYLDAFEASLPEERLMRRIWNFQTTAAASNTAASPAGLASVQSQPGLDFIHAMRAPGISASAIEAYQRCPRQFAYSAIYHFSGETESYQLFWQATHKTVEALHKRLQEGKGSDASVAPGISEPDEQELQELYQQHWQDLGGPDALFAPMYEEHGQEVVEAIRRKFSAQYATTRELRTPFDVDVAGKKVHVTVDRVESAQQTGEPIKFVRTRFGKRKDKPAAETRELLYALAYRQSYPGQQVEMHSHNMSTGETVPITLTSRKEQSLYASVEQAIKGLEANRYPALPAEPFHCPTCPFFLICPA